MPSHDAKARHTPGPYTLHEVGNEGSSKGWGVGDSENNSLLTKVDEDGVRFAVVAKRDDAVLWQNAPDMADILRRLVALNDDGDLSDGEFGEKASRLLDVDARAILARVDGE